MNILKNTYTVSLFITLVSIIPPASAQSEAMPARGPIPFTSFDKDANGFISEQEFYDVRGERMAAKAAEGRPMRGVASAPSFSDFDTNGDGQLTQDELAAGQKARMESRPGMGTGQGMGQGMGQGRGMGRNMPAYSDFDLNGDGIILEKEFYDARSKRITERAQQGYQMKNLGNAPSFTDIDTNGDGGISAEEFSAHQIQHRQQRAQ